MLACTPLHNNRLYQEANLDRVYLLKEKNSLEKNNAQISLICKNPRFHRKNNKEYENNDLDQVYFIDITYINNHY